ncbi:MAG: tetratricopeptide repeat protein, partial [Pyrinomonadaceae bacterium]
MKLPILLLVLMSCVMVSIAQEVTVKATTNRKEVESILTKGREEGRINRAFFDEHDRCRELLGKREFVKAEASCRTAIVYVEKLPKEHVLERSGVRATLALAVLWQKRPEEAIVLLNRALEIRKTVSDDSDADTGDLYYLLGQAHGLSND